jgi:hypothetical protein
VSRDDVAGYRERFDSLSGSIRPASAGSRVWRVIPVLVAVAALVTAWLALAAAGESVWLIVLAWAMPLASFALFLAVTRVATAAARNWSAIQDSERALVASLLDDLERRSGKRVAGLGDRVSRALQILREQQG